MQPEHQDPWGEGNQRVMERLMALGVLVEAGSRLAAENARRKANDAEQQLREQARHDQAEQREQRKAERLARAAASRRRRAWARFVSHDGRLRDHFASLPFQEVARHWGQAVRHADTDRTAATVLAAAEDELRRRAPSLIDFYLQGRDDGLSREEAMANAARYVWTGQGPARQHPGRPASAGVLTQVGEELDREIARVAGTLDPVGRARLLRNLEDGGWSAPSLAYIESLLDRAEAEQRNAATMAGAPDDPATAVDEHQRARSHAAAASGRASDAAADAAAMATAERSADPPRLAAESFATPAQQALTAHPTAMSARAATAHPTQRRTR